MFAKASVVMTTVLLFVVLCLAGCSEHKTASSKTVKPVVITTLFPVYDMVRIIAGDRMDVQLLLPPGVEPHHFEPRPADIANLQRATVFIYTSLTMEPWVERLLANPDLKGLKVVEAAGRIKMMEIEEHGHAGHQHNGHSTKNQKHRLDPHVWLDFDYAGQMADAVMTGISERDQSNAAFYRANAETLKGRLKSLDQAYRKGLVACKSRVLMHGGHYAFGYLARRYALTYRAAVGVNADAEPSPRQMAALIKQIRNSNIQAVFAEELVSPRLAQSLASEAGVQVLQLHAAHNLSKGQLQSGVSFVGLMEENLRSLQKGLGCTN